MVRRMLKLSAYALPLVALVALTSAANAQYRDEERYEQQQPRGGGNFFDSLFGGSDRMRGDGRQQQRPQRQESRQAPREEQQGRYAAPAASGADEGELAVEVDRLRGRIRQLTGQVEELEYRNRQLEEQVRAQGGPPAERRGDAGGAPSAPRTVQAGNAPPPAAPGSPAPPLREYQGNAPTGSAGPGRRADVFDPDANPNAPGVPQALGSPNSRAPAPVASQEPVGPRGGRERGEPLDIGSMSEQAASGEPVQAPGPVREARAIPGPLPAPPQRNPSGTGAQPQPVSAPAAPATSREAFAATQVYMQRREYSQAEESLRDFIKKYPQDRLAGDAHYWLGESLYQRQNYRDAAESFLTVSTKYGKIGKAPDALMRLGQALAALGEKDAACATLSEVARKYPTASAGVKQTVEREQKRVRCS